MITQFRVQNYKALRDVTLNLTPIHLLIGPNDSGKTSLLEAMAALCRSVDHELSQAFPVRWEGAELVTDSQPGVSVTLAAEVQNGETVRYEMAVTFLRDGRNVKLASESVEIGSRQWNLQERFRDTDGSTCVRMINRGDTHRCDWFRPPLDPNDASFVRDALVGAQFFRWNARLLSLPCALDPASAFRLQPSGFGLARVLDDIVTYDREQFTKLERRLTELFPSISAIRIRQTYGFRSQPSDDDLIPMLNRENGKGIYIRFAGQDHDVPAAHLSEGVLLVLAYLAILYAPQSPRLLLIEEPENGIHPGRLKEVIGILRELITTQTHTQVVLTSHSPYIVSLFEPEEVTLCRKNAAGEVEVRRLSESQIVREQSSVFSLGEIWPAEEERIFAETQPQESLPAETRP